MSGKSSNLALRKRGWLRLLTFSLLLVPCLIAANRAGVWVADYASDNHAEQPVPAKTPELIAISESLNFGNPWETDAFPWKLVFKNVSDERVTLHEVRAGCDCTKVNWEKEKILMPGEQATVSLLIDLLQLRTNDPSEIRSAIVPVFATTSHEGAEQSTNRWVLEGGVHRLLKTEPPQVGLSEELTCGEPGRPLQFRLTPNKSMSDVHLKKTPDEWKANLIQVETQPPTYVLNATPCKLKVGPFVDEFQLETVDDNGRAMPTQSVKVEGRVVDRLQVLPRPIDLGSVRIGTAIRVSLWVHARNGKAIQGVDVAPSDTQTKVICIRNEGARWRIDLERVIDAPGKGECMGIIHASPSPMDGGFLFRWDGTVK